MGFNIVKRITTQDNKILHVLLTNGVSEIMEIDNRETAENYVQDI